ncbi:hypothetical protein [Celeribacter neptunius]|uniref:Uncharacterized protein n=1 Tax=Celeribacter neptunius TaxID=588602 RepID=A0A1I3VKG4_9RHOB|nr:hypothetical protein [Celeribacter neptunius]SFJ94747.1 hypothetical protein SAMN04487991_3374 [Celeribacter neptunius]
MRKFLLSSALVVALSPVAATAELSTQEIVDMFPGAQRIEIKRGIRATRVEVYMNGEKLETSFDNETNEQTRRETRRLGNAELSALEEMNASAEDDLSGDDDSRDEGSSYDHESDDSSDDRDHESDDGSDHDSRDDSSDHDSGDRDGGDRDGGDHDSHDDESDD